MQKSSKGFKKNSPEQTIFSKLLADSHLTDHPLIIEFSLPCDTIVVEESRAL